MLNALSSLFGYIMLFIYQIVQNYGIAIIIFTILVKILLLPFTIKQQKSLERTQELQPLMQELQRKYGNDQQKFAEEYQKLLKSKNMSLLSSMGCTGCLLSLIQIPIVLAMFYMMASPLTHILKIDEATINTYKDEINNARKEERVALIRQSGETLGSGDEEIEALIATANEASYLDKRYYEIDIIKEKGLIDMDFLNINLCDVAAMNKANKFLLVIPILSTVFTYLSLLISTNLNKKKGIKTPSPDDSEIPMPDMRVMNIMMPIMMGYVAYSVPQGVGLYWATNNLLSVIQSLLTSAMFTFKEKKKGNVIEGKIIESKVIESKNKNKTEKISSADEDKKSENVSVIQNGETINKVNKPNNSKKKNKSKKKKKK